MISPCRVIVLEEFQIDTINFDLKNVAFPFPENNALLSSEKILTRLGFAPAYDLKSMLSVVLRMVDEGS